jgi:arylsulfatase A-like enzyme
MIIRWPGCLRGHVDAGLHYNLDLAPTLSALYRQPARPSWDGRSYAESLLKGSDTGREYLVLGQSAHVCQRAVRFRHWIYVRTYHDGFHLFPEEMLFDLKADPHETVNLAEVQRQVCMEAVYCLNAWHDAMMRTMPDAVDPLWTVIREGGPTHARGFLKKYAERLVATGRGDTIEELKRRHPAEFE